MKTTKDNLRIQLDAAGRAHMMAVQRNDHAEVEKQFKRIRKLLKQTAKARS